MPQGPGLAKQRRWWSQDPVHRLLRPPEGSKVPCDNVACENPAEVVVFSALIYLKPQGLVAYGCGDCEGWLKQAYEKEFPELFGAFLLAQEEARTAEEWRNAGRS